MAHPHVADQSIAIVHNGIIENYVELKEELIALGVEFTSQTDSEVVVHLLNHYYQQSKDMTQALQQNRQASRWILCHRSDMQRSSRTVVCSQMWLTFGDWHC